MVGRDALLELGPDTYLNTHAAISCLEHIRVGAGSGLSWDTSVFDFNGHDLVIDGVTRPISQPVYIGEHVWVGSRATILPRSDYRRRGRDRGRERRYHVRTGPGRGGG